MQYAAVAAYLVVLWYDDRRSSIFEVIRTVDRPEI